MPEKPLIGYGYWRTQHDLCMPDAAWFIDPTWAAAERHQVTRYLRQGLPFAHWMGYDQCQFYCQIPGSLQPYRELTDGTYAWPELLPHYLEHHQVRLPQPIVSYIMRQSSFPQAEAVAIAECTAVDKSCWQTRTGWNTQATTLGFMPEQEAKEFIRRYNQGKLFLEEKTPQEKLAIERMVRILEQLHASKKPR